MVSRKKDLAADEDSMGTDAYVSCFDCCSYQQWQEAERTNRESDLSYDPHGNLYQLVN